MLDPASAIPLTRAHESEDQGASMRVRRARISALLNVAWFRRLQLSEGVPRVFQELHLSQVRAQRVSCSSHCGNRGVTGLLGCFSRLLGGVPKRLPLLSD